MHILPLIKSDTKSSPWGSMKAPPLGYEPSQTFEKNQMLLDSFSRTGLSHGHRVFPSSEGKFLFL